MTTILALAAGLAFLAVLSGLLASASGGLFVYTAGSGDGGVSRFRLDPGGRGELEEIGVTRLGNSVTALAVSPDRRFLYAHVLRDVPCLASLAIDPGDGGLDLLSVVPAAHRLCYLTIDASGRYLLGASYREDFVSVHPIGPSGFAQGEPCSLARPGRNAHSVILDSANRFVFVANLGSDQVSQFLFNAASGTLTPNRPALVPLSRAAGPRHMVFSPNRRFVYLLTELSGEIICLALDAEAGVLAVKQALPMLPPGETLKPGTYEPPVNDKDHYADPAIWCADIRIAPDGRFVYASERTSGILSWFAADAWSGSLTRSGFIRAEAQPRGFNICPRGRWLVCAGEKSDHIALYAIDPASGGLAPVCRRPAGKGPVWVEMVET